MDSQQVFAGGGNDIGLAAYFHKRVNWLTASDNPYVTGTGDDLKILRQDNLINVLQQRPGLGAANHHHPDRPIHQFMEFFHQRGRKWLLSQI